MHGSPMEWCFVSNRHHRLPDGKWMWFRLEKTPDLAFEAGVKVGQLPYPNNPHGRRVSALDDERKPLFSVVGYLSTESDQDPALVRLRDRVAEKCLDRVFTRDWEPGETYQVDDE